MSSRPLLCLLVDVRRHAGLPPFHEDTAHCEQHLSRFLRVFTRADAGLDREMLLLSFIQGRGDHPVGVTRIVELD